MHKTHQLETAETLAGQRVKPIFLLRSSVVEPAHPHHRYLQRYFLYFAHRQFLKPLQSGKQVHGRCHIERTEEFRVGCALRPGFGRCIFPLFHQMVTFPGSLVVYPLIPVTHLEHVGELIDERVLVAGLKRALRAGLKVTVAAPNSGACDYRTTTLRRLAISTSLPARITQQGVPVRRASASARFAARVPVAVPACRPPNCKSLICG